MHSWARPPGKRARIHCMTADYERERTKAVCGAKASTWQPVRDPNDRAVCLRCKLILRHELRPKLGTIKVHESAHAVLKFLFREAHNQEISLKELAKHSGFCHSAVRYWAYAQRGPSLYNLEAALNYLGYTLTAVPIKPVRAAG